MIRHSGFLRSEDARAEEEMFLGLSHPAERAAREIGRVALYLSIKQMQEEDKQENGR